MSSKNVSIIAELPEIAPSEPLPLPSRFGRYRLTRLLAIGGMAQIYLAKSFGAEGFVKPLVIKRLDPKLARRTFFTDLFINEAKLLVTLSHGNIVPVFDFGRVGDDLYMAMEYVHGASLGRLTKALREAERTIDQQLAAFVAMEICKGLDYAHRKTDVRGRPAGIIHRDIKPNNILISIEGEVKIVDFGVAKLAGRLESRRHLAGTLGYMSPEQANQQPVDARTDVFSTGLVLHELLTGKRVYGSESFEEALGNAKRARIPDLPAQVSRELRAAVERACARRPEDRYPAAHMMEQALSTHLLLHRSAGELAGARSPGFQLAQLMRELALTESKGRPALSDTDGPPPTEGGVHQAQVEAPQLANLEGDPDLALIQGAAETFHSEFFTRVLQQQSSARPWARVRRPIVVLASVGLVLALLVAALVVLSLDAQRAVPAAGADVQRTTAARTAARPELRADAEGPKVSKATPQASPDSQAEKAVDAGLGDQGPADTGPARRRGPRAARVGYLNLNSIPWAEVTIDGRRLKRTTPVLRLPLPPGVHRIELSNPKRGLSRVLKVRVRAGKTTWKVVKLRR